MSRTRHHGDKKKEELFGKHWNWMRNPSWFTHLYSTRPGRAAERAILWQVCHDEDYEERSGKCFPDGRKPEQYYW